MPDDSSTQPRSQAALIPETQTRVAPQVICRAHANSPWLLVLYGRYKSLKGKGLAAAWPFRSDRALTGVQIRFHQERSTPRDDIWNLKVQVPWFFWGYWPRWACVIAAAWSLLRVPFCIMYRRSAEFISSHLSRASKSDEQVDWRVDLINPQWFHLWMKFCSVISVIFKQYWDTYATSFKFFFFIFKFCPSFSAFNEKSLQRLLNCEQKKPEQTCLYNKKISQTWQWRAVGHY